ncbi:patatin-like phospholipase family protein [Chitinibacteraceae bacterium HSL-7]
MKRRLFLLAAPLLLAACTTTAPPPVVIAPTPTPVPAPKPKPKIGLALGGGAAKGFAHIGVIKMLEANGIVPDIVTGTSAGSVVGALYASGLGPFALQENAFSLDEAKIRDFSIGSGGLVKGEKLQAYVNELVAGKKMEQFPKRFAAVATELDTGKRTVFVKGSAGLAVRASSAIPGVFEPVVINKTRYVDGGVVSPVPVDAARQLGADIVIAVDISAKANGAAPDTMLGIANRAIVIMGQKLGEQEMQRADLIVRPKVGQIGATDFDQRNLAILEGEKAMLAQMPQLKALLAR